MFDIVRNNRRLVQLFLALIILPFAFFGVESYMSNGGTGADVARVGDSKITMQEFSEALRDHQDRLRASAQGREIPQEMLDTPEIRRGVIEMLVSRHLLADFARKTRIVVSDEQLSQLIATVPALQVDGKFSPERYDALVSSQGMTKDSFEARLRQDMMLQQAAGAVAGSSLVGKATSARWLGAQLEEREISMAQLKPQQYLAQVKLGTDAARKWYDANRKKFEAPQMVRAEFVVLAQAELAGQATVSEAEVKAAYEGNAARYKQAEQRRASHILILADKEAAAADVAAAKAKAEGLLAELKKAPGRFAELATRNSQDPGSAAKGGDLDWFGRGMMVKPFEDTVFALKEGQISDVVRSDFGFHVITVTGVRSEQAKPLEEVRGEIEAELRQQSAAKKYAEAAESFSNIVYEQADSLQPAADKFKLAIHQSGWIAAGIPGNGLASNPKLLAALFTDDAIKNKRNTEAVEVAPNTLVSARVIEVKPATVTPFETIKDRLEQQLMQEEAGKLAAKDGEDKLVRLRKGEAASLAWSTSRRIVRGGDRELSPETLKSIFRTDTSTLPAFAGAVAADGSYALYRIDRVFPFNGNEGDPRAKALQEEYAKLVAGEEFAAWMTLLREEAGVEINEKLLLGKEGER
jgi:peptidyl-prolyl cis-trans isomerase D